MFKGKKQYCSTFSETIHGQMAISRQEGQAQGEVTHRGTPYRCSRRSVTEPAAMRPTVLALVNSSTHSACSLLPPPSDSTICSPQRLATATFL